MDNRNSHSAGEWLQATTIIGAIFGAVGIAAMIYALTQAEQLQYLGDEFVLLSLVPGLGVSLLGVVIMAWTRALAAMLDQTENSRILLEKLEWEQRQAED